MKILLIGGKGQLGTDLRRRFFEAGAEVFSPDHAALDICSEAQIEQAVEGLRPDFVVNTSAFHKVEECEKQPLRSFEVNATGPHALAKACAKYRSTLVHFSTDYVFDGKKRTPYQETDLAQPLNVYGASKLAGENLIAASAEAYFLVRTSGLYGHAGSSGKGGNFIENMLKKAAAGAQITVVDDQVLTPTATADLALAVWRLMETPNYGLYHITCEGSCSWYRFTQDIFALEKVAAELRPAATSDVPSAVQRPAYSALSKDHLRGLGIAMPAWQESLERYLKTRPAAGLRAPAHLEISPVLQ
ncbi:MAG: dTDP-4-dehydrorhamnose reductase [Acidobacteria bacterium]|nr:dTDP-4-dehydrorhamnose reductase [Acidobacteriota bacterium]